MFSGQLTTPYRFSYYTGAQTSGAQMAVRPNGGAQTAAAKRRRPNDLLRCMGPENSYCTSSQRGNDESYNFTIPCRSTISIVRLANRI